MSAANLQKCSHSPQQNALSNFLSSTRPHLQESTSLRSTNSNLQLIPHEQSFDSILKRYRIAAIQHPTSEKGTDCNVLSIHAGGRTTLRQKIIEGDAKNTDRIRRNLQVLKGKYILLPEISRKHNVAKKEGKGRFEEEGDYEDHARTALQLKQLGKKPKREKENAKECTFKH